LLDVVPTSAIHLAKRQGYMPDNGKPYHAGLLTFLVTHGILYTTSTHATADRVRTFAGGVALILAGVGLLK